MLGGDLNLPSKLVTDPLAQLESEASAHPLKEEAGVQILVLLLRVKNSPDSLLVDLWTTVDQLHLDYARVLVTRVVIIYRDLYSDQRLFEGKFDCVLQQVHVDLLDFLALHLVLVLAVLGHVDLQP